MRLAIRLALAVLIACAAAARAEQELPLVDVTKHDMHPLVQLHAVGSDIIGKPFETDVFIYRGGPTFLAYTAETGNARRVARGVATPQALMALNQALAAARVGQQTGNCGGPAPDYVSQYALTWYGAKQRVRTIQAGGNYTDCPSEVIRIFDATCGFIWSVLGPSPEICVPPGP
jgi:hypothetical protein